MPQHTDEKNLAYRTTRKERRGLDREEKIIRNAAKNRRCYQCALKGLDEKATEGQLCEECFETLSIPTPGVVPM